jgi:chemotaxis protein MotB
MNGRWRVVGVTLLVVAALGCVSSSKYKKLQAEQTALQTSSQQQQSELQAKAKQLTDDNAKLKSDIAQLQSQNDSLNAERASLQQKNEETASKYDEVVNKLSQEVSAGELQIKQYKNMLSVDVAEQVFFASGSATMKEEGKKVLSKVGDALNAYPDKVIRVVGHTDNVPLSKNAKFPSNWELSTARATNVVRYLQDKCKVTPERLVASGRGPYSPVASNDTPEGRQKNRRIEIMLIDRSAIDTLAAPAASN